MYGDRDRERVRDALIAWAHEDERIARAALVGSSATGTEDRWSDVDLSLGVRDGTRVATVMDDWTRRAEASWGAVPLLDLTAGATRYRVLPLPGCLQVDLSFTPADAFGPSGPRFKPLFGSSEPLPPPPELSAQDTRDAVGWALLYALAARAYVARGRLWQAEHYVSALRTHALTPECLRRGLPAGFGRGFDALPRDVLERFEGTLVRELDAEELTRALRVAAAALQAGAAAADGLTPAHRERVAELVGQLTAP